MSNKIYTITSIQKLHKVEKSKLEALLSEFMVIKSYYSEEEYDSIKVLIELYLGEEIKDLTQICWHCSKIKKIREFKIDHRTRTGHSKMICQECFNLSKEIY